MVGLSYEKNTEAQSLILTKGKTPCLCVSVFYNFFSCTLFTV